MIKSEDQMVDDFTLDPDSPSSEGKEVKRRNRLNPRQVTRLMEVFEQTAKPKADIRHKLAEELGMHPRAVQIWFQNRRQKLKKESLEANSGESQYPLDKAKLTLCDTKPMYTNSQASYLSNYGLTLNNFPHFTKPSLADNTTTDLQSSTNIALLSGLGLGPNQGSIHPSTAALSLSSEYHEADPSLDNQISNSTLSLLQGCNTVSMQQNVAFPNMFDANDMSLALDVTSHSGTPSISATSSNTNCTDHLVDMDSSVNSSSPFMYTRLDSLGLDLSTQISMLQRQQTYPQSLPMKRKAYSWQDLCQLIPQNQDNPEISNTPLGAVKFQGMKRNASEVGYNSNPYPIIAPSNRSAYSRSLSDPFAAESYAELKRRRICEIESENEAFLTSTLSMEQENPNSSSMGGLSDMLAYL
ncbi:hypothetical protein K7432_002912 [Basidiobolus ranarum]|uniref:Homeobox domain-containing protein n=3 Tax=Basidiobolus TaxID=4859 RepID=A0ABR2W6Z9_9FUNG